MARGRSPGFAASRGIAAPAVPPGVRAEEIYRDLVEKELVDQLDQDIARRLVNQSSDFGSSPWYGVPKESIVHHLIPAMLAMRYTARPVSDYEALRQRIISLMKGHQQELEDALAAAETPEGQLVLGRFGISNAANDGMVADAQDAVAERISSFENSEGSAAADFAKTAENYRLMVLATLVNASLAHALAAGDAELAHRLRLVHLNEATGSPHLLNARLDPAFERRCLALARLDNRRKDDFKRNWLITLGGPEHRVRGDLVRSLGSRFFGDAAERDLSQLTGVGPSRMTVPVCVDADAALAQARGLLRNPFISRSFALASEERPDIRPLLNVVVEPHALRDLDDQLRDSSGWRGYWVTALRPERDSEPTAGASWLSNTRTCAVALRIEVSDDAQGAQINFIAPVGSISARGDEGRMRQIYERAEGELETQIADELDLPSAPWEWNTFNIGIAEKVVGPVSPAGEVLGPDVCDHRGTSDWTPTYSQTPSFCDSLSLRCSRCLRNRVLSVPLHRLPPDHPVAAHWLSTHEKAYLEIEEAHSLLGGKVVCKSIEELRRRDGLVSLDPENYASGVGRKQPSVASVSAAMNRR